MKRLLGAFTLIFAVASGVLAVESIWYSSTTATADTTRVLCPKQPNVTARGHGIYHGVCVSVPTNGLSGMVGVYNSSASAVNIISSTTTGGYAFPTCSYYDVAFSSGLTYTNTSTATVTLMYGCSN